MHRLCATLEGNESFGVCAQSGNIANIRRGLNKSNVDL